MDGLRFLGGPAHWFSGADTAVDVDEAGHRSGPYVGKHAIVPKPMFASSHSGPSNRSLRTFSNVLEWKWIWQPHAVGNWLKRKWQLRAVICVPRREQPGGRMRETIPTQLGQDSAVVEGCVVLELPKDAEDGGEMMPLARRLASAGLSGRQELTCVKLQDRRCPKEAQSLAKDR